MTKTAQRIMQNCGYSYNKYPAIAALTEFVAQPAQLSRRDYDSLKSFSEERNRITRQLEEFKRLLSEAVSLPVTDNDIMEAAPHAFSGRLTIHTQDGYRINYCVGQYYPTEYRTAACAVLQQAIRVRRRINAKTNPPAPINHYDSIEQIKEQNERAGHHFFDRDSMRFFGSAIHGRVIGGRLFITSEKPPHGERRYSVRAANPDGSIDTIGEFMEYSTEEAARQAARIHKFK